MQRLHLTWKSLVSSFVLPSTFFNYAKALVILKLKGGIVLNPSSFLGFPNLKTLLLENVWYEFLDSFSKLLSCCPVLQNLYLETYIPNYDNNFKITVPTLKTLHLSLYSNLQRDCRLEINAPALKYLHFRSLHLDPHFTEVNKIIKKAPLFIFSCSIIKWLNTNIVVIIMWLCSAFVLLLN